MCENQSPGPYGLLTNHKLITWVINSKYELIGIYRLFMGYCHYVLCGMRIGGNWVHPRGDIQTEDLCLLRWTRRDALHTHALLWKTVKLSSQIKSQIKQLDDLIYTGLGVRVKGIAFGLCLLVEMMAVALFDSNKHPTRQM